MSDYLVASIVLINNDGHLIFQRRDNKPGIKNPNSITVWGGAVEAGETPLQAAVREIREETNLRPTADELEDLGSKVRDYRIDGRTVVAHVYALKGIDELQLKVFEGAGYVVIDPANADLGNPDFIASTRELIELFRERPVT